VSKYREIKTEFREEALLRQALQASGVPFEEHAAPAHLVGYRGDERPETAQFIIRRHNLGSMSNDLGFARQEGGTYAAIVSDYDQYNRQSQGRLARVKQEYARAFVHREARRRGLRVTEQRDARTGAVHLTLRG